MQTQPCPPCSGAQIQVPLAEMTTELQIWCQIQQWHGVFQAKRQRLPTVPSERSGTGCVGRSSSCCKCCRKGFGVTGLAVPVKKLPWTALEVTPSYSQLQRQPNILVVGVTTQTCNKGSSGNTSVTKLDRVTEQSVKNRNCCPPSPKKQQTHNSSDSWMNRF